MKNTEFTNYTKNHFYVYYIAWLSLYSFSPSSPSSSGHVYHTIACPDEVHRSSAVHLLRFSPTRQPFHCIPKRPRRRRNPSRSSGDGSISLLRTAKSRRSLFFTFFFNFLSDLTSWLFRFFYY